MTAKPAAERRAPDTAYGGAGDPAVPGSAPTARPGGHPHGRTRSWLLVVAIIAAFTVGGVAVIVALWWLFWVAAGLVALGVLGARLIRLMDDTVEWDVPLDRSYQPQGHVIIGSTPPHVPRRREKR